MYNAFTPAFATSAANSGFHGFGSGFDVTQPFAHEKNAAIASPLTDSLEDDLSSSSGGIARGSAPPPYLAPSSTSSANLPGATGMQAHIGSPGGDARTPANSPAFGAGSPLFHFYASTSGAAAAAAGSAADDDADGDSGLLDYAGLESLLMAAVGDGSNAPTPTHASAARTAATAVTAAAAAPLSPQQPSALSVHTAPSRSGMLPTHRSTDSISPLPSHGSPSLAAGGGSPNVYSGENAFLFSNFGPDYAGGLPTPHILRTHVDTARTTTTSPLMVAAHPVSTPGELSVLASSALNNSSCTASQSAASILTGGNGSVASQSIDAEIRSNLFVCGLPISITDSDLSELFGKFGPIESAKVMLDIHSGRSRGIAFVKFSDVEHAENAVDSLNGTAVSGHLISVRVANSRAAYLPGNPTNKTFVRNVPPTVPRSTLMSYFSQFGAVTDLSIMSDTAQGRHRHHGTSSATTTALTSLTTAPSSSGDMSDEKLNIVFITYESKEAAAAAAEATHTKTPFKECNGVPLLAKVAEDTTRRMERLSRRVRGGADTDAKELSSTAPANPLGYGGAAPTTTAAAAAAATGMMQRPLPQQPQLHMGLPTMMQVSGAGGAHYPAGAYVAVQNMSGTDLSSLAMMPATLANGSHYSQPQPQQQQQQQQQQQVSVFRDANGNVLYTASAATPAATHMTYPLTPMAASHQPQQQQQQTIFYTTQTPPQQQLLPPPPPAPQHHQQQPQTVYIQTANGIVAAQSPQFHVLAQQQQQQQQQQQSPVQLRAPQGQVLYMQTANGSVVPVMYGGAAAAPSQAPSMQQAQGVGSYYMVMHH